MATSPMIQINPLLLSGQQQFPSSSPQEEQTPLTSNNHKNTTTNQQEDEEYLTEPIINPNQDNYQNNDPLKPMKISDNNNDDDGVNVAHHQHQHQHYESNSTKKFRSKAFLRHANLSSTTTITQQKAEQSSFFSNSAHLTTKEGSQHHHHLQQERSEFEAKTITSTTTTEEQEEFNTCQNNNNNNTKQVDPYSLANMKSNNQQTETNGKRKSSSSTTVDTITHARKLVSGFGISTKDSKIDMLYATKLSSVSNSKKKLTRKTSGKEMERFLFCKYCKLSNKSLDSGRLQLKTCSLCREVRYCCKEHQVSDWPKHKFECNCAVRALNNGTYSKILQKGDETNRPQIGDSISVHYVAKLLNDTIVDKTYKSIETNKHCSVSYDTSDDEEGEEGFDDDKDLYIVKPPSNSYTDFENWLSHANNKFLLKQRKSDVDSEDEITSTSTNNSEVYDSRASVASSFSELSFATTCTDSRLTLSQRSEDDLSLYSSNSSALPPITNHDPEDAEDNWSTDSSGRGGGTSSSTSTVSIIFDSVAKDIEVVPDLLQFTIGKGQVNPDIEKHLCQMSLGERRHLFVSPKSRQNPNKDILAKRVKKLSDFTVVYEIMIVQILRKKQENNHFHPSPQPITSNSKPIYGQDEFTKGSETYQSCFYEPFRRFIPSAITL